MVYFIFDKVTKQTVTCGNVWINNKTNDMLTGVNGNIELYGNEIQDQELTDSHPFPLIPLPRHTILPHTTHPPFSPSMWGDVKAIRTILS